MGIDLAAAPPAAPPMLEPVLVISPDAVDRIVAESRRELSELSALLAAALEEARLAESTVADADPSDDVAEALIRDGIRAKIADRRAELARALETALQEADRRVAEAEEEAAGIRRADAGWVRDLLARTSPDAAEAELRSRMEPAPVRFRLEPEPAEEALGGQLIEPPPWDLGRLRAVALDALLPLVGVVAILVLLLLLLG